MRKVILLHISKIKPNFKSVSVAIKNWKKRNPNWETQSLPIDLPGYSFRKTLEKAKKDRNNYSDNIKYISTITSLKFILLNNFLI